MAHWNCRAQTRDALRIEERLALIPRAWDEHDQLAIAIKSDVKPLSRSAAVGVGQHRRSFNHVGLFQIILRHCDAPRSRASVESCNLCCVAPQCQRERFGNGFAGKVILCGAKAAYQHKNVYAAECGSYGIDNVLLAVAD